MAWSIIVAFAVQDLLQFSGEWFFHLSFIICHFSFVIWSFGFEEAVIFSAHTRTVYALKPAALPN